MSKSYGNNGNNLDLMVSVRHEPKRDEITGHALITMQKFIESLSHKPLLEVNLKRGAKNIKHGKYKHKLKLEPIQEQTHISVKELINVYKWSYQLCSMATFLPIFSDIIKDDMVNIENITKFNELMYKVMGE